MRPNHGDYAVGLDNDSIVHASGNSQSNLFKLPLREIYGLPYEQHTIQVTNEPTAPATSYFDLDFVQIERVVGKDKYYTCQKSNLHSYTHGNSIHSATLFSYSLLMTHLLSLHTLDRGSLHLLWHHQTTMAPSTRLCRALPASLLPFKAATSYLVPSFRLLCIFSHMAL